MVEIIASDFNVNIVGQNEQNYVLANTKNVFFHFVFLKEKNGFNEIKQYYVHRFELADWLNKAINKKGLISIKVASALIDVAFHTNEKEQTLTLKYNDIAFVVNLTESDFGKQLLTDLALLDKIEIESTKKGFKKKIITSIVEEFNENESYPFSDKALCVAAFELKILKTKKSWQRSSSLYRLLKFEYKDSDTMDPYLASNLSMGLDIVVGKSSCNCTNDGCFFELLNTAYTTFFKEDDLLTDGKLDEGKVEIELGKIWKNLSAKQRSVLNFLDYQFGNTPLINLYLLTPNADFEEYIYKMTYPYQPDSEDDAFVRRSSSLVKCYLAI
jgi:hypothetical protein